jgi:hypothetical protein
MARGDRVFGGGPRRSIDAQASMSTQIATPKLGRAETRNEGS